MTCRWPLWCPPPLRFGKKSDRISQWCDEVTTVQNEVTDLMDVAAQREASHACCLLLSRPHLLTSKFGIVHQRDLLLFLPSPPLPAPGLLSGSMTKTSDETALVVDARLSSQMMDFMKLCASCSRLFSLRRSIELPWPGRGLV